MLDEKMAQPLTYNAYYNDEDKKHINLGMQD